MNWSELVEAVADRSELSQATVKSVMDAFEEEVIDALTRAESVSLKGVGKLEVREVAPRAIRRIDDQRKFYVGRRHRLRLKAAAPARRALKTLSSEAWRQPEHQAAWRRAETLLSDLDLYHGKRAPKLAPDLDAAAVRAELERAFGALWERVRRSYEADVTAAVRESTDYLAEAALRRWSR